MKSTGMFNGGSSRNCCSLVVRYSAWFIQAAGLGGWHEIGSAIVEEELHAKDYQRVLFHVLWVWDPLVLFPNSSSEVANPRILLSPCIPTESSPSLRGHRRRSCLALLVPRPFPPPTSFWVHQDISPPRPCYPSPIYGISTSFMSSIFEYPFSHDSWIRSAWSWWAKVITVEARLKWNAHELGVLRLLITSKRPGLGLERCVKK